MSAEHPRLPMIEALARTLNTRDAATFEHSERVRRYALALGETVSSCDLDTTDALAFIQSYLQ